MSDAKTNLTLVVGYDGSDGARRALARVRELTIDYARWSLSRSRPISALPAWGLTWPARRSTPSACWGKHSSSSMAARVPRSKRALPWVTLRLC